MLNHPDGSPLLHDVNKTYSLSHERLYVLATVFLPADQAKYGHAEGKESHDDPWDRQAEG